MIQESEKRASYDVVLSEVPEIFVPSATESTTMRFDSCIKLSRQMKAQDDPCGRKMVCQVLRLHAVAPSLVMTDDLVMKGGFV